MNEQPKYAVFISPPDSSSEGSGQFLLEAKEMEGDYALVNEVPTKIEDCLIDENVIACIANCSAEDVKKLKNPKFFFKALMDKDSQKYLFNVKKVTSLESLFHYNGAKDFVKNVFAAAAKNPAFDKEVKGYGVYSRSKEILSQIYNLKDRGVKIEKIAIVKNMVLPVVENTQVYKEKEVNKVKTNHLNESTIQSDLTKFFNHFPKIH